MWWAVLLLLLQGHGQAGAVDSLECRRLLQQLWASPSPPWAVRMLDASTKVPEGLLAGHVVHLGNFDECLQVEEGSFRGKYCLSSLTGNLSLLGGLKVEVAVCVPSSCPAQDVEDLLQGVVGGLGLLAVVSEDDCQTSRSQVLTAGDWAAVAVFALVLLLLVLSTAYELLAGPQGHQALLSFSLLTNGRRLLSSQPSSDSLACVHGLRVLSMAWVVLGHRYSSSLTMPMANTAAFLDFVKDWRRLYVTNATLSVDTFLLLSGMLVAYVFLKDVPRRGTFNLPAFYLHRYIRLTPLLVAVVLANASFLQALGSGPLWGRLTRFHAASCEDNWWPTVLYVHNYVNNRTMCVGHSWYLAVDMQLYLLSPLLLWPLWKRPRLAYGLLAVLLLVGWSLVFSLTYVGQLYPVPGPLLPPDVNLRMTEWIYIPTHARFTPWLVGVGVGSMVASLRTSGRKVVLSKLQVAATWLASCSCMVLALATALPFLQPDYHYDHLQAALYASLSRLVWAMGVSGVLLACVTGHGGPVNGLLSWAPLQPLGRLTYAAYLVHPYVQLVLMASVRTPQYLADVVQVPQFLGDLVISTVLAVPCSLAFESPFMSLAKLLLGGRRGRGRGP